MAFALLTFFLALAPNWRFCWLFRCSVPKGKDVWSFMVKKRSPTIKKLFSNKVSLFGSPTLVMKFWGNKNTNCPIQSNAQCHRHCRAEPTYIFWDSLVSSFSSSNGDSDNDLNQAPCPLFRAMPERKHFWQKTRLSVFFFFGTLPLLGVVLHDIVWYYMALHGKW